MKARKLSAFLRPFLIAVISILLIVAAGLTGCKLSSISKTEPTAPPPTDHETNGETDLNKDDVENEKEDEKEEAPPPPPEIVYYNALTGLETTSELAALRPVAVCIENTPYCLPQYGLSHAQVLIEAPTAQGQTKLMMLTTDYRYMTTIGAVTSTRPYFAKLSRVFGGIHCFNGSDKTLTEDDLANYDTLDAENKLLNGIYYNDESRFNKDDEMTNGILLDSGIRRAELNALAGQSSLPYAFADKDVSIVPSGTRAIEASIRFTNDANAVFTYDAVTGEYRRSQFGAATLDGTTGEQISFKNVMILYASSTVYQGQTQKSMDFIFTDGGTGTYITNGQAVTFHWTMDDTGNMHFTDADGVPLVINRGTTYMGIVSIGDVNNVYIR